MNLINKTIKALEEVNINDFQTYDLESENPFYNFVIVASGTNRQSNAALQNLKKELNNDSDIRGVEGKDSGWLLIDLGDLIVHIFDAESKEHYKFDERFINVKQLNFK